MEEKLTLRDAARKLGVSPATVQNWCRTGLLPSLTDRSVSDFLNDRNREPRLTSRANKSRSRRAFSPSEYGSGDLKSIPAFVRQQKWTSEEALYYAFEDLTGRYGTPPRNPFFSREMDAWKEKIAPAEKSGRPPYPEAILSVEDFPGWLYQTLQKEGIKSANGSYYTAPDLVEDLLGHVLSGKEGETFFDPCCGTGGFLLPAARFLGDPERVCGQDRDPLAVRLARLNLMRLFPERSFDPSVYRGDSLLRPHRLLRERTFSAIATNPPWGSRFSPEQKALLLSKYALSSGESASLFILASLDWLSPGGRACLLLPESLLHRQRHRDIRDRIGEKTERIDWYGHRFTRVQSECFALTLNGSAPGKSRLTIRTGEKEYEREKSSFAGRPFHLWDIFTSPEDGEIFGKLFQREHRLLGEGARWGLGIVTGNNGERLLPDSGGRPILSGRNISPFNIGEPELFIDYDDVRLHQKAPRELYDSRKIVYRFIASRPVAAWDDRGCLTLNSVNFLIPGDEIDPVIAVLLLNSDLYGEYFEKTFHTLKILRGQLETLPVPLLTLREEEELKALYPRIRENYPRNREKLNRLTASLFGLTEKERQHIEG